MFEVLKVADEPCDTLSGQSGILVYDQALKRRYFLVPLCGKLFNCLPDGTQNIIKVSRIWHSHFVSQVGISYLFFCKSLAHENWKRVASTFEIKIISRQRRHD